jgi:hypothetical protein
MKKIRINELARELEVKAHLILEALPELGVAEKMPRRKPIPAQSTMISQTNCGSTSATKLPPARAWLPRLKPTLAVPKPRLRRRLPRRRSLPGHRSQS